VFEDNYSFQNSSYNFLYISDTYESGNYFYAKFKADKVIDNVY